MYYPSESQQARRLPHQYRAVMDTDLYNDFGNEYMSPVLHSRTHSADEHLMHFSLSGHISTYLAPNYSFSHQAYSPHDNLDLTPHGPAHQLVDPHAVLGSDGTWSNLYLNQPSSHPPFVSNRDNPQGGHYALPSPISQYSLAVRSPKPSMNRGCSQSEPGLQIATTDSYFIGTHLTPPQTAPDGVPVSPPHKASVGATVVVRTEKKETIACPEKPDPYAAGFLKEQLGERKWDIFTSRLAENRKNGSRSRMKAALAAALESGKTDFGDTFGGASAIDFLVKVEVVKAVLRTYVPHPYSPQKSSVHPYPASPRGHVVVSRSSVLSLSGWSNTQFAYWARRAEGVSVLCNRDHRLRTVAAVLERQLKGAGVFERSPLAPPSLSPPAEGRGAASPTVQDAGKAEEGLFDEIEADPERWVKTFVTGKGLDAIIDEVKKRFGVSQFLRGKHSSLDSFGATVGGEESDTPIRRDTGPIFMPTFQAESYVHEVPALSPTVLEVSPSGATNDPSVVGGSLKRKASPEHSCPSPSQTPMIVTPLASHSPPAASPLEDVLVACTSSTGAPTATPASPASSLPPLSPVCHLAMTTRAPCSPPIIQTPDGPYNPSFGFPSQLNIQLGKRRLPVAQPLSPVSSPDVFPLTYPGQPEPDEAQPLQPLPLLYPSSFKERFSKRKCYFPTQSAMRGPAIPPHTQVQVVGESQKGHFFIPSRDSLGEQSVDQQHSFALIPPVPWKSQSTFV